MSTNRKKLFFPPFVLFLILNGFFTGGRSFLARKGFDQDVLLIGNTLLFLVTMTALYLHVKGFYDKNVNVFLRSVYSSLLVKMFVSVAAVGVYAYFAGDNINKPSLFTCMALYFLYTIVEVRMVFRLLKEGKKNG
ncbi:MAG TPA: hypothetical protein PKE63_13090 [Lacibacter sp.]|nr:hypothetical protein [Lacibacter sp.]HMO89045.1 hypothetical protein [Lacibacter sp.]HMP88208.1 hypothetical protein [Lacibacter sp.]